MRAARTNGRHSTAHPVRTGITGRKSLSDRNSTKITVNKFIYIRHLGYRLSKTQQGVFSGSAGVGNRLTGGEQGRANGRDLPPLIAQSLPRMRRQVSRADGIPRSWHQDGKAATTVGAALGRSERWKRTMSLNIKSNEAHRSARELARLTGESMTAAVTVGVRERLDRLRCGNAVGLADRLLAIGRDCAARPKERFRSADHSAPLYYELGLPR